MKLDIDPDVLAVVSFMQERLSTDRLVSTAKGIAALAPLLWGQYRSEELRVLRLVAPPISGCGQPTRSSSSESPLAPGRVGDDSAAA